MVIAAPLPAFLMVTATPARGAPVRSVTTPERLAPVWAHAGNAPIARDKRSQKVEPAAVRRGWTRLMHRHKRSLGESMEEVSFKCYGVLYEILSHLRIGKQGIPIRGDSGLGTRGPGPPRALSPRAPAPPSPRPA